MLGELLVDLYDDVPINENDALDLGFSLQDATKYIHLIEPETPIPGEIDPIPGFGRHPTLSLEFANASMRDAVKKLLLERCEIEKKKSGDLIADALGLTKKRTRSGKKRAA